MEDTLITEFDVKGFKMDFKRHQSINNRLVQIGWEIPLKTKYRGIRRNHKVRCIHCGYETVKRVDNLLYREETCPSCGHDTTPIHQQLKEITGQIAALQSHLQNVISRLPLQGVYSPPEELETLFRRYIAKYGLTHYKRKISPSEWYSVSHQLAQELIDEVSPNKQVNKKLTEQYKKVLALDYAQQGQTVLFKVLPENLHNKVRDCITIRYVKL